MLSEYRRPSDAQCLIRVFRTCSASLCRFLILSLIVNFGKFGVDDFFRTGLPALAVPCSGFAYIASPTFREACWREFALALIASASSVLSASLANTRELRQDLEVTGFSLGEIDTVLDESEKKPIERRDAHWSARLG
jgi:hypothetical protein